MQICEESMANKKAEWAQSNHRTWVENTKSIYSYHKEADAKLHESMPQKSFVQARRQRPKLPGLKAMVTPFLKEAIEEELQELDRIEQEMESEIERSKLTDSLADENMANYFTFNNPQALRNVDTISVAQSKHSLARVSQDSNLDRFQENPHLGLIVAN